jgi:holo-[acyl-carrier protein] synthase
MAILGVGIDLLALARLQAVVQRRGAAALARRVLSGAEMLDFQSLDAKRQLSFLALRQGHGA